jgi:hypothetical protein
VSTRKATRRPKARTVQDTLPRGFVPTPIRQLAPSWIESLAHEGTIVSAGLRTLSNYPFASREAGAIGIRALEELTGKLERIASDARKCTVELSKGLQQEFNRFKEAQS